MMMDHSLHHQGSHSLDNRIGSVHESSMSNQVSRPDQSQKSLLRSFQIRAEEAFLRGSAVEARALYHVCIEQGISSFNELMCPGENVSRTKTINSNNLENNESGDIIIYNDEVDQINGYYWIIQRSTLEKVEKVPVNDTVTVTLSAILSSMLRLSSIDSSRQMYEQVLFFSSMASIILHTYYIIVFCSFTSSVKYSFNSRYMINNGPQCDRHWRPSIFQH